MRGGTRHNADCWRDGRCGAAVLRNCDGLGLVAGLGFSFCDGGGALAVTSDGYCGDFGVFLVLLHVSEIIIFGASSPREKSRGDTRKDALEL